MASPADAARRDAYAAARHVWEAVAPGFGPAGAWKLVDGEVVRASAALRALTGDHLATYRSIVERSRVLGAHSALTAMLASRTVMRVLDAPGRLPQRLHGVVLARRQLLAWLAAQAATGTPEHALQGTAGDAAATLVAGVLGLGDGFDLDAIDVRAGAVEVPTWTPGLVIEPAAPVGPRRVTGRVLIVDELLDKPRQAATLRTSDARAVAAFATAEAARVGHLREALHAAGVAIVVCRKGDAEVAQALAHAGIIVVTDAPLTLVRRVALATGARAVARVADMDGALGDARATRRPHRRGGWLLAGDSASATLEVPGTGPVGAVRVAEAETWLRAAAPVIEDPRTLAGGGRWQVDAAQALRRAADHAPGAAPLGIGAVADALDDIARALVTNLGFDATRHGPIAGVTDACACVRPAVAGGLDAAIQILRIDGTYSKRPSTQEALRGGGARVGSPRGMPGDVPPLM